MRARKIQPPDDVVAIGISDGTWLRLDGTDAFAIIYWKGGPGSPDRDIILHWIEAKFFKAGLGTALLREINGWADSLGLTVNLLCEPHLADWYARNGYHRVGPRYDGIEMRRLPMPGSAKVAG